MNTFLISLMWLFIFKQVASDLVQTTGATQSWTYNNDTRYSASKAVDGDIWTCSYTWRDSSTVIHWWQVDLSLIYTVESVVIINTNHSGLFNAYQYLEHFIVFVGDTDDTNDPDSRKLCYDYPVDGRSNASSGQNMNLPCKNHSLVGRFVTVRIHGSDDSSRALVLCEFYVYGYLIGSTRSVMPSSTMTSTTTTSTTTTTTTTTTTKPTTTTTTMPSSTFSSTLMSQPSSSKTLSTTSTYWTVQSNTSGVSSTLTPKPSHTSNVSSYTNDSSSQSSQHSTQQLDPRTVAIIVGVIVGSFVLIAGIILAVFLGRRCSTSERTEKDQFDSICNVEANKCSLETEKKVYKEIEPIKITELENHITNMKSQRGGFVQEFKLLPGEDLKSVTISKLPVNSQKNRFQNVLPYNDNTVVLRIETDDNPTDNYINASYIRGYKDAEKRYIATQGPTSASVNDFWRMVWQQNVSNIVMITPLIENNKRKCEQYWPENLHEARMFGWISVSSVAEDVYADYVYRQLVIHDTRHTDEPARIVRHLHFVSWVDKSRPDQCFPLLAFRQKVNVMDDMTSSPLVVHCSAGIGRTGTYIAIDYLLDQAEKEDEVSVFRCVEVMRHQRMNMVQTADQYEFIHESILDGVTFGNTGIPCSTFTDRYRNFSRVTKMGSLSEMEKQFELLNRTRQLKPGRTSAGLRDINLSTNRNKDIVAYDDCRPYLMSTVAASKSDYINAVFVDGFRTKKAYVLTQVPLPNTVNDFWCLVWDHGLETIVLLEDADGSDETLVPYWPEGTAKQAYGQFEVQVISVSKVTPTIVMRQFSVINSTESDAEPLKITQYQFSPGVWPSNSPVPSTSNVSSISQLIRLLNNNQGKLLLQCSDGVSRSGFVAAAMHLLDMMRVEQIVNVFLACRYVIVNRPQAVSDLEQYKFLHELALRNIRDHDEYANLRASFI